VGNAPGAVYIGRKTALAKLETSEASVRVGDPKVAPSGL
jgi:hypothetical protein